MPSPRVPKYENEGTYFVTMTIKNWYYVFDRHERWTILADAIEYASANKGLKLYAFVFMLNHIHLIIDSPNVQGFLRDFKRHTSKMIHLNLLKYEPSVLKIFIESDLTYRFWDITNYPRFIYSDSFYYQKREYIHQNPVKKNYVTKPEHWYWSSANSECVLKADESGF